MSQSDNAKTTVKRKPKTRVTTVRLSPPMRALSNAEKVECIQNWIDSVNIRVLVMNVCKFMLSQAKLTGNYFPVKFAYTGHEVRGIVGNKFKFLQDVDLDEFEISTPLRLPIALHDEVIEVADRLGCFPSDVMRMAIGGIYLDSGAGLLNSGVIKSHRTIANYRAKPRRISVAELKREKEQLKLYLSGMDPNDDRRKSIEARIAAIKV